MPFSKFAETFDSDTLDVLTEVFNAAWDRVQAPGQREADIKIVREMLAARILPAAREGERDPAALLAAALRQQ
jgi:hypothetical protein